MLTRTVEGRRTRVAPGDRPVVGVRPLGVGPEPVLRPLDPTAVLGPPPPTDRLRGWAVTVVLSLVAGLVRFAGLGHPTDEGLPVFDEKYYVPQAWQMLRNGGVEDWDAQLWLPSWRQ